MKYRTKLKEIGGSSLYALVPSVVRKNLSPEPKDGDDVMVEISEVNRQKVMQRYRCKKCQLHFESDDDIPYCPACDCEDVETLYQDIEPEGGKNNGDISTSREY